MLTSSATFPRTHRGLINPHFKDLRPKQADLLHVPLIQHRHTIRITGLHIGKGG